MAKEYNMSFEEFMKIDFNKTIDSATKSTLNKTSEKIKLSVEQLVPVESGKLRNSFEIVESKNKRVLGTTLDYAPIVEHGSRNTEGKHFLERSLDYYSEEEALKLVSGLFDDILEIDFKG